MPEEVIIVLPADDPDPYSTAVNAVGQAILWGLARDGQMNDTELKSLKHLRSVLNTVSGA